MIPRLRVVPVVLFTVNEYKLLLVKAVAVLNMDWGLLPPKAVR